MRSPDLPPLLNPQGITRSSSRPLRSPSTSGRPASHRRPLCLPCSLSFSPYTLNSLSLVFAGGRRRHECQPELRPGPAPPVCEHRRQTMSPMPLASAASSCPRPCLLPILLVLGLPCRQEPRPAQARDPLRRPPRRQPWPPRAPPVAAPCLLLPDPVRMGRERPDPCPSGLLCHPASPEACSRRRVHVPCELPASSEATFALTMPSLKFRKRSVCEDSFDYVGLSSSWVRSSSKRDHRQDDHFLGYHYYHCHASCLVSIALSRYLPLVCQASQIVMISL